MKKLASLPFMDRGIGTSAAFQRKFLKMAKGAGVESAWTIEHPIVADNDEKHTIRLTAAHLIKRPCLLGEASRRKRTDAPGSARTTVIKTRLYQPLRNDTEMCDPLEWLAFAAGVTDRIIVSMSTAPSCCSHCTLPS